ncbi:UNVERIFIED_CONTAM: hypothetical protein K2H54_043188 [Gekko kuhli]
MKGGIGINGVSWAFGSVGIVAVRSRTGGWAQQKMLNCWSQSTGLFWFSHRNAVANGNVLYSVKDTDEVVGVGCFSIEVPTMGEEVPKDSDALD